MKGTILIILGVLAASLAAAQDFDLMAARQELVTLLWQAGQDSASISEIEAALLRASNLLHNWQGVGSDPDETPLPSGQRPSAVLVASLTQLHQVFQNLVFARGAASLTEALVLCDRATVEACDQALDRLLQPTEERKLWIYERLSKRLLAILLAREADAGSWELLRSLTNPNANLTLALQRAGVGVAGTEQPEVMAELLALRDENFRLALKLEAAQEANAQLARRTKLVEDQLGLDQQAVADLMAENLAIRKAAAELGSSKQLIFLLLVAAALLLGIIGWCLGWARGWRQARGRPL